MAIVRNSRQRDAILNTLKMRYDHPTADMIYESVRTELPNISLGTVYRNLAQLEEQGSIIKFSNKNRPDRYDGNTAPHYHYICDCCGSVYDMPTLHIDEIRNLVEDNAPGRILKHNAVFYGICRNCESK